MKSISKLKDEARRHEQKEDWEKAIEAYLQVLRIADESEAEVDLPLYNRLGDLSARRGRPAEAVRYYEKAADGYAEAGLYNNAIALCNKALRYNPDRPELLRKLGQFSASQGFLTDARRYFLEYAEQQFRNGAADDALSALEDFADLSDDPEIRETLGRRLHAAGRSDAAVRELRRAFAGYHRAGETDRAAGVAAEVQAIDPAAALDAPPQDAAGNNAPGPPSRRAPRADALPELEDIEPADATPGRATGAAPPSLPELSAADRADPGTADDEDLSLGDFDLPGLETDAGLQEGGGELADAAMGGLEGLESTLVDIDGIGSAGGMDAGLDIEDRGGTLEDGEPDDAGMLDLPLLDTSGAADEEAAEELRSNALDLPGLERPAESEPFPSDLPLLDDSDDDEPPVSDLPGLDDVVPAGSEAFDLPGLEDSDAAESAAFELPMLDEPEVPPPASESPGREEQEAHGRPDAQATPELAELDFSGDLLVTGEPPDVEMDLDLTPVDSAETPVSHEPQDLPDAGTFSFDLSDVDFGEGLAPPPADEAAVPDAQETGDATDSVTSADAPADEADPWGEDIAAGQTAEEEAAAEAAADGTDVAASADLMPDGPGAGEAEPPIRTDIEDAAAADARESAAQREHGAAARQGVPGGGDFVDLGAFLTEDEEEATTRFQVQESAPTGDEDRDFAELLSQFKAKLSEHLPTEEVAAHYDLGLAFKEMGLLDEAIGQFQIALRAEDMRLRVYEELGHCFLEKQQYNIAEKVLRRALTAPHEDELDLIGVYYQLGRTYEALGRPDQARDAYERVLGLDIAFQDVAERVERL